MHSFCTPALVMMECNASDWCREIEHMHDWRQDLSGMQTRDMQWIKWDLQWLKQDLHGMNDMKLNSMQ